MTDTPNTDAWLLHCLEDIGHGDPKQIEGDDYEIYGEDAQGRSGTCTVSIRWLCLQAVARIRTLEAQQVLARAQHAGQLAQMQAHLDTVIQAKRQPVVPASIAAEEPGDPCSEGYAQGWNDCRATTLTAAPAVSDNPRPVTPKLTQKQASLLLETLYFTEANYPADNPDEDRALRGVIETAIKQATEGQDDGN